MYAKKIVTSVVVVLKLYTAPPIPPESHPKPPTAISKIL